MANPVLARPLGLAIVGLGLFVSPVLAGDTTPPSGPVAPTMRTLDEVEPRTMINLDNTPGDADSVFRIDSPGSYYLIGNLKGFSGKHGIEIASDNVTIDLMGFHVSGVTGSIDGIKTTVFGLQNITILNGTVEGWGGNGIDIGLVASENSIVDGVRASQNATAGIRVGHNTLVTRCVTSDNTFGILSGVGCVITDCTVRHSTGWGLDGGFGGVVTNCTSYDNDTNGIVINAGTITDCTAAQNGLNGIQPSGSCTVTGCTAQGNAGNGFSANSDTIFLNNTSTDNGDAGIYVFGDNCRIEGNNCIDNTTGIEIDGDANYIIRNVCTDNTTNFDLAENNRFGAIIDHTISSTIPVVGNSAGSAMGTTDPWANFANTSFP